MVKFNKHTNHHVSAQMQNGELLCQHNVELRFRRCIVQSTLGMAPLNLCFNILFYVFLLSLFLTFHYLLYPVWLCMWQIIKNLEPWTLCAIRNTFIIICRSKSYSGNELPSINRCRQEGISCSPQVSINYSAICTRSHPLTTFHNFFYFTCIDDLS